VKVLFVDIPEIEIEINQWACPASHMASISSMIAELTDEVGNPKRILKESTDQRTLLPDPATNIIQHEMASGRS